MQESSLVQVSDKSEVQKPLQVSRVIGMDCSVDACRGASEEQPTDLSTRLITQYVRAH